METILPTQIEFYDLEDKTFKVKVGVLNGIRFNKIIEINQLFRDTKKEVSMLLMLSKTNPEQLKDIFDKDDSLDSFKGIIEGMASGLIKYDEVLSLFNQRTPDIIQKNLEYRIEIIKIMLDLNSTSNDRKELFNNKEFWEKQDVLYLQNIADTFRTRVLS